ncbi:integrase core domain-containing protein [Ruegeria sp. HU-ET01832]|uniref:integrase core domain-containing protein n=1 Tax=Ruegeria sp. HU-ET01832 TaxID=3135906 RepID=UPI00333E7331
MGRCPKRFFSRVVVKRDCTFRLIFRRVLEKNFCFLSSKATSRIEQWRKHYNTIQPHSALSYRPQALKPSSRWISGK